MTISQLLDKTENFQNLSQKEQVRLISYFFTVENSVDEFSATQIKKCFEKENLKLPTNISSVFSVLSKEKPPIFIRKNGSNYVFERNAKKLLVEIYFNNHHSQIISNTLRDLILKLNSPEQKNYLEEAISCFEIISVR